MLIDLVILALVGGSLVVFSMWRGGRSGAAAGTHGHSDIDIATTATKIRQWLEQGAAGGHS
jgi:hypothetical protein